MIVTEHIKAKLIKVISKEITCKNGENITIKEAIFEHLYTIKDDKYSTLIKANVGKFFDDKLPKEGTEVSVSFYITGKEYNGTVFNNICIQEIVGGKTASDVIDDDIPF